MWKFLCALFFFSHLSYASPLCIEGSETTCAAEERATKEVNRLRTDVGSRPLTHDAKYSAVARDWSKKQHDGVCGGGVICHDGFPDVRMNVYFQKFHTQPNFMGENVAMNWEDNVTSAGSTFMEQWSNSPGHYGNMVDSSYKLIGNGFYCGSNGCFGTQIFGY